VSALFESLDITGATLVGWSLGVLVALSAYSGLKERLSGIVLVSGTPKFVASDDYPFGLPEKETRGLSLRLRRSLERTYDDFSRMMFTHDELNGHDYEDTDRQILRTVKRPLLDMALRTLEALACADMRAVLPTICVPALMIHGDMDRICLPEASRYMASLIPGASLTLLKEAGHVPLLSRPEEFNTVLAEFLERVYGYN
jgi:pimeloyl-[acyl-carrier protein] methyl ester esterase